jgi:hypothetical protein
LATREREGDLQEMVDALKNGKYSALILDAPVLEHLVGTNEECDLFLVGEMFETFSIALAFPPAFSDAVIYAFSQSIVKLQVRWFSRCRRLRLNGGCGKLRAGSMTRAVRCCLKQTNAAVTAKNHPFKVLSDTTNKKHGLLAAAHSPHVLLPPFLTLPVFTVDIVAAAAPGPAPGVGCCLLQTYQGALDMLENVYIKTGGTDKCFGSNSGGHGSGEMIELRQGVLWLCLVCFTLFVCTDGRIASCSTTYAQTDLHVQTRGNVTNTHDPSPACCPVSPCHACRHPAPC